MWSFGAGLTQPIFEGGRLHTENEALRAQQDDAYDHDPQAETVEEAARDVGKWLNERPNRPLDLRHVAMLTHHAKRTAHVQNPAEIEHVAGNVSKNGAELNVSTQQQECGNTPYDEGPFALAQPVAQRGAADGFFLLLPQRPKPEAPAGTAGLDWDAYSGAQMLAFGRDCSDAAIAALRAQQPAPDYEAGWKDGYKHGAWSTQQPAPATQQVGEVSESIEQLAVARYKVVPAHESMFHRWAVVAGDGAQQLYLGREVECENMARKFAGAFFGH